MILLRECKLKEMNDILIQYIIVKKSDNKNNNNLI